jgi:hypothetical protein
VDLLQSSICWFRRIIRLPTFRDSPPRHSGPGRSRRVLALPNSDTVLQLDVHSDYSALRCILSRTTLLHSRGQAGSDNEPGVAVMESYRNNHVDRRVGVQVSLVVI